MSRADHPNGIGQPPGLLISVRDESEVEDAIAGGADWIDFKEPSDGALGAVTKDSASPMVEAVEGRRPISAALGELVDWPDSVAQQLMHLLGIDVVKLGLAGCGSLNNWESKWQQVFKQVADHNKQLCAVIYADWKSAGAPEPAAVLDLALRTEARYLLIDTWDKRPRSSLECIAPRELKHLISLAHQSNLQSVLAGSLQLADIALAVLFKPDLIAVRGAACRGPRIDKIDERAVRELKQAIAEAAIEIDKEPVSKSYLDA